MDIFIQLQTPTVELEVKSRRDPAGEFGKIRVGFRRYDTFSGQEKYNTLLEALRHAEEIQDPMENLKQLHELVLKEIEYIYKATVKVQEGTQLRELIVDTRKPPVELWQSSEEAVSSLLRMYLSSAPWRNNLLEAMFTSFSNRDLSELAEIKN